MPNDKGERLRLRLRRRSRLDFTGWRQGKCKMADE
jgi:hypothetical protein